MTRHHATSFEKPGFEKPRFEKTPFEKTPFEKRSGAAGCWIIIDGIENSGKP
jgi:hypothetical protein